MPRIITGVKQFRSLLQNPSKESTIKFVAEALPNLERAMNLYGASLRKGEVPDEISRTAAKLTEEFVLMANNLLKFEKGSEVDSSLIRCKAALDVYLKFANLSPVDSTDYSI